MLFRSCVLVHNVTRVSECVCSPSLPDWTPPAHDRTVYDFLYDYADAEGTGILNGQTAARFLSKSGLERPILKQVRPLCVCVCMKEKRVCVYVCGCGWSV